MFFKMAPFLLGKKIRVPGSNPTHSLFLFISACVHSKGYN